jgi:hypothetical protein
MRLLRFTLPLLAALPLYASADMCDTVAKLGGGSAAQCRANTASTGATIYDNWVTYAPVSGKNPATGKKGLFISTSTPAFDFIGFRPQKFKFLYMECFLGKRQMRFDDTSGNLSVISLKDKILTFRVDNQPAFTETWELKLDDQSDHAPASSVLATKLQGAKRLDVTWHYINDKPKYGYSFAVSGFNQANASLCK